MIPAPPAFDGAFSEFFDCYVLPNLPAVERVREFDQRLRSYLSGPDPVHPIRNVRGQERGVICKNNGGTRMLPTDNSPVWWIHAFLMTDNAFPDNNTELFERLPCHMFKLPKGWSYLNATNYHAAHLVEAKNGKTDWEDWTRKELYRRVLVNIHPCNMVLIAKTDWQYWGGQSNVLEWASHQYQERYGSLMTSLISDCGGEAHSNEKPKDFHYSYPMRPQPRTHRRFNSPVATSRIPKNPYRINRPLISKNLSQLGVWLEISAEGSRYHVPHDLLLEWVESNTGALETRSWRDKGLYSWPRPSRKMTAFLKKFEL
jgi:hypothetical protein